MDRFRGSCQCVQAEYAARECPPLEYATGQVTQRGDWLKPKSANANWRGAVAWLAADRADPQSHDETRNFVMEELGEAVSELIEQGGFFTQLHDVDRHELLVVEE